MAEKVCANCGAEVPAAAVFCTQCGSRDLNQPPPPPPEPDQAVAPPPPVMPDSPTVPVTETQEAPSLAAQYGAAAQRPEPPGAPTMADQPVVGDPTSVWSTPPAAPQPPTASSAAPASGEPTAVAPAFPPGPAAAPDPTFAPTAAPPATGTSSDGGGKLGAALALLGGAAAIVGAFLSWMKITPDWADAVTLSGWTLTDDAKVVAAVGAVAFVAAAVVLGGSLRRPMRVLTAVAGIVILGLGAYDTYDILQQLPDSLADAGVSGAEIAAPQLGLILVLAGGAVVVLGALAMTQGARPAEQELAPPSQYATGSPGGSATASQPVAPPPGGYAPPTGLARPVPGQGAPHGGGAGAPGGYGTPPGSPPPAGGATPPPSAPFGREWS